MPAPTSHRLLQSGRAVRSAVRPSTQGCEGEVEGEGEGEVEEDGDGEGEGEESGGMAYRESPPWCASRRSRSSRTEIVKSSSACVHAWRTRSRVGSTFVSLLSLISGGQSRGGAETHRPRANIERDLRLRTRRGGGGGKAYAADVEDHVAAAALEPVDEDASAGSATPDGAGYGYFADEHECGGWVLDCDVVNVDVTLAAYEGVDRRSRYQGPTVSAISSYILI